MTPQPVLEMDELDYQRWRSNKLNGYLTSDQSCMVDIQNPYSLAGEEYSRIHRILSRSNFFIYQYDSEEFGHQAYQPICHQLGLLRSISNPGADSQNVTKVQHHNGGEDEIVKRRYIPYSNRALGWHTDGYYNQTENQVRSFVLHCEQPALRGGENYLVDHEIIYILLRDKNPKWTHTLTHDQCLTIPENVVNGKTVRNTFVGPMISTDSETDHLYLRYTERKNHIQWREHPDTAEAIAYLRSILSSETTWTTKVKLESGQGLICNNILHSRTAFQAGPGADRCLHRIRFKDRIAGLDS